MVTQKHNLNLIQVLRGIASLLVVFFHATVNSQEITGKEFFGGFFLFGGAGVDIFFVLSGFIITYTSLKGLGQPGKLFPFMRRRFVRIFPAYWIIISLFLLIQILLPSFYTTHYSFMPGNFVSTYFLFPGHTMVNGVSWTLSYEIFFYLLFSFAFLIPNKKWAFWLAMLYAVAIILIQLSGNSFENGNNWINLLTYPMNVEFFMGVLAAVIIPRIPQKMSVPLVIAGSILFLAAAVFFNNGFYLLPNTFNRVVIFGIPSFFIITGIVKLELTKQKAVHNIFLLLGESSYSLYLVHLPLLFAFIKMTAHFNIQNNFVLHLLLLSSIVIICFVSLLFYKWIENPLINKLNTLVASKK